MKRERDPNRLWMDNGTCYVLLEKGSYVVVHDKENLAVIRGPEVLLQTPLVQFGETTPEGVLVKGAAVPWFEILKHLKHNPDFMFEFSRRWRKLEELIAGAYCEANWHEVTLTPRRGDKGRDVIASKAGLCSIRVHDQAKAYSARHLVTHDDVRAMLGVLHLDRNASKGIITTTSDFQPRILSGDEFLSCMPYRLELRNGQQLLKWLLTIQEAKLRSTKRAK